MTRSVCLLIGLATLLLQICLAVNAQEQASGIIDPKSIEHEQGYCYVAPIKAPCTPGSTKTGNLSPLVLYEDGKQLGPANAGHGTIREVGKGAYSHWSGTGKPDDQQLYFSTSDNSDPRTNGRTYKWVVRATSVKPAPCALQAVPDQPLQRDRHTTLLAHFDAKDNNDAAYARVERTEVGVGNNPDAPGRFGDGVAVEGGAGCVRFLGLDNFNPRVGTVEFWAQSRAKQSIWNDGIEHWFLVLYPERAGAGARYNMAPHFIVLRKTPDNQLELKIAYTSAAPYSAAVRLRQDAGWTIRVPVADLDPTTWHHILISWDLRGQCRMWLLVDGKGVTADEPGFALPPNPGIAIVFGGFWGLPGDNVRTSDCNLDELRIQDCTVQARLAGAKQQPEYGIDTQRLLQEEDLARAMLDKLMELQFHGGWAAGYNWPTYTPTGWSLVGRGVDMWFTHSAYAGGALMRGWLLWGDDRYLDAAIEAADMFCETQLPNGSWNYHYTYSRGEFMPWGKYAYIAQSMQSNQIRFLCMMYRLLGYKRYEQAIRKAGDWMVSIQHPNGAWGWETYPADKTGPHGHPALNDRVTPQAMWDLFIIWCATGDDKYLEPVLKGAQWIIDAQAGPPTYGWADQYDKDNNFIWMRSFEPPAVSMQAISAATWGLCLAYDLTGDDKYLQPLRKVLKWMDSIPEDQRGWLWYDPATNVPVVAYYYEMLPVTDPKAIKEIIPRLDAHYGTKYPWQADSIRNELKLREQGPIYPDWRGVRPHSAFAEAPTIEQFASNFNADHSKTAREQLAAWAAGKPLSGLVGGNVQYGRTFEIGRAISYCEQLITDIENARVALGDIPPQAIPRYRRGGGRNWVYMEPQRDYYATPLMGK